MFDLNSNIIKRTTSAYDDLAIAYSQCWSDDTCMQGRLDNFLRYLPKKPLIADIGCGTGRDMKYLIARNSRAIGIDISRKMLKEAKKLFPEGKFVLMDMRYLGLPSNIFDGIWASASVLHIPKCQIETVLQEIHRILKTGGLLFLSMQEGEDKTFAQDGRFFAYYTREELNRILQNHQFQILEFEFNESHKNTFNKPIVVKWINYWARKTV